jgi:hypothetical protein
MLVDDRLFARLMNDDEAFVGISPGLCFEVLLRRVHRDLEASTHTMERSGRQTIPVFDTGSVVGFLGRPGVIEYLAHMLASFTRIQGFVVPVRVRKGIRRRIRFNDMDVDSLIRVCSTADEAERVNYYKRIADVCLFITGVFREHAAPAPTTANRSARQRRSLEIMKPRGSDSTDSRKPIPGQECPTSPRYSACCANISLPPVSRLALFRASTSTPGGTGSSAQPWSRKSLTSPSFDYCACQALKERSNTGNERDRIDGTCIFSGYVD